jgi:hypothetical protein
MHDGHDHDAVGLHRIQYAIREPAGETAPDVFLHETPPSRRFNDPSNRLLDGLDEPHREPRLIISVPE